MPDNPLRKRVRVMPPGTVNPLWRKVNIRGKSWPHTRSWLLTSEDSRTVETVIDSGGWLPGLPEAFIEGYVPGGWTLPVDIVLDFVGGVYTVSGTPYTLDQIFDPNSKWGKVDPAALVPGVGLYSPGGQCNFAFTPTLAHILVYLGMDAKINYTVTGLGDLNICFADDEFRVFSVADGSDTKTNSCKYTGPAGNIVVHRTPATSTGSHRFDLTMTTVTGRIRTDRNEWTELIHTKAAPEPMQVVGRVAGPLTVTRMQLTSLPQGMQTLPVLPINLPDEIERPDTGMGPKPVSASTSGNDKQITIFFDVQLDYNSRPGPGDFIGTGDFGSGVPTGVTVNGARVILQFGTAYTGGPGTVSYTPGSIPLQDRNGVPAQGFGGFPVEVTA